MAGSCVTNAIRIHRNGGSEVMQWEEARLTPLAPDQARVRHTAIGVNFSDINVRRGGFYLNADSSFPIILGNEAAGVIEAVGDHVADFKVGDRVCYAGGRGEFNQDTGAYSEVRHVFANRLLKIPEGVSDQQAAALLLKGLTASLIVNRVFKPTTDDYVLIHTAASGVGILLCQWSRHLGATVLGTVGSSRKAEIAREHGCDHPILYREADFVAEVKKLADEGVSVVFDGVGKETFLRSIECVRQFGCMVNYGNASGHVPLLDLRLLARRSISVCRPGVGGSYLSDVPVMREAAAELFSLVQRSVLKIEISEVFPLKDAAIAHQVLESRQAAGSLLLIP